MTDQPEQPTPDERAEVARKVNLGLELALRWVSSLNTANQAGAAAARVATMRQGVGTYVTDAMAFLVLDVGRQLLGVDGFQAWLDQQTSSALDFNQTHNIRGQDGGSPAAGS